ncbi:MAG: hypothetical protein IT243_00805 [Bacteroidia bacterium]|nr:hypothetical protein [Bacteroidia bacterium]
MMAGKAYNTANFYISPGSVSYTLKDLIIAKSNFNGLQLDFLIRLLNSDNPPPV